MENGYLRGIHQQFRLVARVDDDAVDEVGVHELGAPEQNGGGGHGDEGGGAGPGVGGADVALELVEVPVGQLVLQLSAELGHGVCKRRKKN